MTVEIELTQGRVALIDQEDLELVSRYRWRLSTPNKWRQYAQAHIRRPDGRQAEVRMHRLILGLTDPSVHVDHINGDGLDNRRANLRHCSPSENHRNRGRQVNNTSGLKGVYWQKDRGKWKAQIQVNRKNHYLGRFTTAEEAHLAYCRAADELHGAFANYGEQP